MTQNSELRLVFPLALVQNALCIPSKVGPHDDGSERLTAVVYASRRTAAKQNLEDRMLLLSNLPHNCSEGELRKSLESRGVKPFSIRIIRDRESAISPAFGEVELWRESAVARALACCDGMRVGNRLVHVWQAKGARAVNETVFTVESVSKRASRAIPR
jgi:hypothetical protein